MLSFGRGGYTLPVPRGGFTQPERQHLLGLYAGILVSPPVHDVGLVIVDTVYFTLTITDSVLYETTITDSVRFP